MSPVSADQIELTPAQKVDFFAGGGGREDAQRLALRVVIVLLAAQGWSNTAIAGSLGSA